MKSTPIRNGLYAYFGTKEEAEEYLSRTGGKRKGSVRLDFEPRIGLFRVTEIPPARPVKTLPIRSAGTTAVDDGIWIRDTTSASAGVSASPATKPFIGWGKKHLSIDTPFCRNCGRVGLIQGLLCPLCK